MRIIPAFFEIISFTTDLEKMVELAGRVCYKSENRITVDSYKSFLSVLKKNSHESVMEHGAISVRFICDRGISHELVRHRLASFSQESTRYCNYGKDSFDNEITVINPRPAFPSLTDEQFCLWADACEYSEMKYMELLSKGLPPQFARDVLPTSLKTELILTANPREWRHIFNMRIHKTAHPQMRELMIPCLASFKDKWPILFGDIDES